MALIDLRFYSEALGMQTEAYVVIPQKRTHGEIGIENKSEDEKYKCLYLLHGLSDDHSIWLRRTSIERYASEYGICVVMPDAHRSFYTDMKYGGKYYTYIAKELPERICDFFNVSNKREDNYIAGNSMGGYGALKIALRESEKFCAAAGLSSVTNVLRNEFKDVIPSVFGAEQNVSYEDDLFYLVEKNKSNVNKPRIYMGIGTEDFMYADNLRLKSKFEEADYDYTYYESAGGHSWKLWDQYIQYVLEWMLQ